MEKPRLLLSVDFEDWHQLVHRRLGLADWDRPHATFQRQTAYLLDLLDELDARARRLALNLAASATRAIGRTKSLVDGAAARTLEEQLGHEHRTMVAGGADFESAEGVAAFLEKRPARFS